MQESEFGPVWGLESFPTSQPYPRPYKKWNASNRFLGALYLVCTQTNLPIVSSKTKIKSDYLLTFL